VSSVNRTILISPRQSAQPKPIAFLDRDGILNMDTGYVHDTETAAIVDGAIEAVKLLNGSGFLVIVVSNQSGVARGYFNEASVIAFNEWLTLYFKEGGAIIDAFYFCPHHPEHGSAKYKIDCECRKPNPGMLRQACSDLNGDMTSSFLIGDRQSDMAAAAAADVPGYLFEGGNLEQFLKTIL